VALLALTASACTEGVEPSATPAVSTIAFLFDGSPADAELVTAPALAGLELAAHQSRGARIEIEPVNLGEERAEVMTSLRALGEDRGVVAAVVAPWTAPPSGAAELLAASGLPVVTLSWAWGPPADGDGRWLSLAAGRAREAVMILSETADIAPEGAPLCLAGDDHATSEALLETAAELSLAAGAPEVVVAGVAPVGEAPARAVAARVAEAGCPALVWTGGTIGAASVLSSIPDVPRLVVGTSRIKTDDGLALASAGVEVVTVCGCADVSLSMEPDRQRFVHDLQAESGAPPGAFAVEAYDAGRLLIGIVDGTETGTPRERVVAALHRLTRFGGLDGGYAFEQDGSRAPQTITVVRWRATGSRWLPAERSTSPSA
jgi:ABC-type branched-subunit amino acid transport system substrate-binding protein